MNELWIGAEQQPDLGELVSAAAERCRVAGPVQIGLCASAVVRPVWTAFQHRGVVIGLPLLRVLSRADLTALVEHELGALAASPDWRLLSWYAAWSRACAEVRTGEVAEGRTPDRAASDRRRAEAPAAPIAWAAARAVGDPAGAAIALIRAARAADGFRAYLTDLRESMIREDLMLARIVDLYDGWRHAYDSGTAPIGRNTRLHGRDPGRWDEPPLPAREAAAWPAPADALITPAEVNAVAIRHPALAGVVRALTGEPLPSGASGERVTAGPVGEREQRKLAEPWYPEGSIAAWHTFATLPPSFIAKNVLNQATTLRKRVAGRSAGLAAAADAIRAEPPADGRQTAWVTLLEGALLPNGWRREHAGLRGVLIGSDGTRLDGRELTRRALTDPYAYVSLREHLQFADSRH